MFSAWEMSYAELMNELYKLYRLRDEGKKVDDLIAKLEAKLFGKVEEEEMEE